MSAALIARNTFREAIRDRVLTGVTVGGLVLLGLTRLFSVLAMGEGLKLTVDVGLSGVSILGFLLILMVGTSLVAKEIERKTIFNLLSRPISRPTYLVGKWLGLSAALAVFAMLMGVALCVLLAMLGAGNKTPAILQAVYLAMLELSVMTSIAVLFSALSTPVLSALYTLGLFLAGQWSADLRLYASKFPGALRVVCESFANLLPNLPLFNMRALAAEGDVTSWAHVGIATAYALVFCVGVLALAAAAFERREFK